MYFFSNFEMSIPVGLHREHILPPVNTDDIVGKWFACIYECKKSRKSGIQLIFGRLISREVINKDIKINID